jgi:hypothetical protein
MSLSECSPAHDAVVGVSSGIYLFNPPLQQYWESKGHEEVGKQESSKG